VALLLAIAVGFILFKPDNTVQFTGIVTAVPDSLSDDGPIVYLVDGLSVDVGGGLRPRVDTDGIVDAGLEVGDEVEVKAREVGSGFTLWDCQGCYLRKAQ